MQSEVNQEENLNTTDFDEHFAKISSYIVDTLHGVPLEMTEDEKEQFRIQVISNQYAERLLSEAEKTETYRGLSKIDILHTVSIPQLARTIPLKGLNLSLEKYRMPDGVIIEVESSSHYLGSFSEKMRKTAVILPLPTRRCRHRSCLPPTKRRKNIFMPFTVRRQTAALIHSSR